MDAYAQNFKREGINSHVDLVWFAKLENYRYYTYKDQEVKQGIKKRGDRKEGEQMHVQVIVSRKDRTNSIKLSPMNTSRGKNEEHSKKMGQFDRVAFKQGGEALFDELFEFDRRLKETMAYANTKKNGSLNERIKIDSLELQTSLFSKDMPMEHFVSHQIDNNETQDNVLTEQIQINITDDVDDEAVYGKNRQRHKPRGR